MGHNKYPRQISFFFSGDMYSINKFVHWTVGAIFLKWRFIIDKIRFRIIKYGGELSVHNKPETLGDIIKYARERSALTVENLADSVGITERYLYKIENENKKPSYDVLFKLIRTLSISPDLIFYPEKPFKDSEIENLLRMISACDEKSLDVIKATAKALIEKYN